VDERTRLSYDAVADDYARQLPGLEAETALDVALLHDFADRCATAAAGPVLDAGCGTGRLSAHLAGRGLDVVGVDGSAGMVAVARRALPGLPFAVAPLEALPLADGSVAGVLAWYSLIHTAPAGLPSVVGELRRVVAPGGWLLTAFQAGDGGTVERTSAYGRPAPMTSYRHDPAQVTAVLGIAGLDVRVQVLREPEGREATPQALLLARRPAVPDPGAVSGS